MGDAPSLGERAATAICAIRRRAVAAVAVTVAVAPGREAWILRGLFELLLENI